MNTCIILPSWRQFVCRLCARIISECRPAIYLKPGEANNLLPTVEYVDCCAVCAQKPKTDKSS